MEVTGKQPYWYLTSAESFLCFQVIRKRSSNISINYFKALLQLCPLPGKKTQSQNGWIVWKPQESQRIYESRANLSLNTQSSIDTHMLHQGLTDFVLGDSISILSIVLQV